MGRYIIFFIVIASFTICTNPVYAISENWEFDTIRVYGSKKLIPLEDYFLFRYKTRGLGQRAIIKSKNVTTPFVLGIEYKVSQDSANNSYQISKFMVTIRTNLNDKNIDGLYHFYSYKNFDGLNDYCNKLNGNNLLAEIDEWTSIVEKLDIATFIETVNRLKSKFDKFLSVFCNILPDSWSDEQIINYLKSSKDSTEIKRIILIKE